LPDIFSKDFTAPTEQELLDFIRYFGGPATKRDVCKGFGVTGDDRIDIKKGLKLLESKNLITKQGGAYTIPDTLPVVTTIEVSEIDIDGDEIAFPTKWDEDLQGPMPRIEIRPNKHGHPTLKEGDQALARLHKLSDTLYEARIIRIIDSRRERIMGILENHKDGIVVKPVEKKARDLYLVNAKDMKDAQIGDIVLADPVDAVGLRHKKCKIVDVLGNENDTNIFSLISAHEYNLALTFPDTVLDATESMKVPPLKGRTDLRDYPLVTIDGADARDFDDAVFAEPDPDQGRNPGGFHLIVAIADVAYYVEHNKALDKEALRRSNSTYFPDRVIPMLPERLSNDLCSLRPKEDRACMAAHLYIDADGQLIKYNFVRGLMKSIARLTYEQVQAAKDGIKDDTTSMLMDDVINPLYAAFGILKAARDKRGALDLELPERQIMIDDKGRMSGVQRRSRLDAHMLIEEFMVLANVASALALDKGKTPGLYRVHDMPKQEKLDNARNFLEGFNLSLPKGNKPTPGNLNQILRKANEMEYAPLIHQTILRTQSQANYSPQNIGHFGLALTHYTHFTSPIRRYADLIVHRALIREFSLGPGGLKDEEKVRLDEIADIISTNERKSMSAEYSTIDRFVAKYMEDKVDAEFEGRINGLSRFGLFVALNESGADGIVPIRTLPDDFYIHDEEQHALIGRKSRRTYRMGAAITVRLKEAHGMSGSTVFEVVGLDGADIPGFTMKRTRSHSYKKGKGDFKGGKKHGAKPAGPKAADTKADNGFRKKKKKKTTPKHKRNKNKPHP
jgi:ribonuclease R